MFGRVRQFFAQRREFKLQKTRQENIRQIRAKFDVAQTTPENQRHWVNADGLSANAAASPAVRKKIRDRSRYECQNNSWAAGIVRTLTHHTIGTGPRLQVETENLDLNERIERAFRTWAKRINLAQKLATAKQAEIRDGEVFLVFTRNESLKGPIKLDIRVIEAEQCTTPWMDPLDPLQADGIKFDEDMNPVAYYFLKYHPGETTYFHTLEGEWYPANRVIHWFRPERPGQTRGLPEILPALPLFAILRRFTLATLSAAEVAALFAVFLKTTGAAVDPAASPADFFSLDIERAMMTTLPEGWGIDQLKPEHPATTYEMFVRMILNEIARCLSMPYNIAACNSSGYNYSSGRLDHQTYYRKIEIDNAHAETVVLERIFAEFCDEAVFDDGGIFDGLPINEFGMPDLESLEHEWFWDAPSSIDPMAEDQSAEVRLRSGRSNLQDEYAQIGQDWRRAQGRAAASFGLSLEEYRRRLVNSILGPDVAPAAPAAGTVGTDPAPATAEFGATSRLQWKRNIKAIRDVLEDLVQGNHSPEMARVLLQTLGLTEDRVNALIDDALDNGEINDPELANASALPEGVA